MKRLFLVFVVIVPLLNACKTNSPANPVSIEKTDSIPNFTETKLESSRKVGLDEKIGQMIMIGILGRTSISEGDTLLLEIQDKKVGGIILFEKNISKKNSSDSLKLLISKLQKASETELFISIDEEGGKVHRLKEKYGFVSMPSAAYLGKLNNLDSTYFYNKRLADELKSLGINTNYAPALDVATNPNNPIIAKVERSFSADPQVVTNHGLAVIKAHHAAGVRTIIKHFPGHGSSADDTHKGVANVTTRWNMLELLPFSNIIQSGSCDAVMTAHIVNCTLDSSCLPATLSKPIVNDLLRNILAYKGVVFSDDMQMHAISKYYGLEQAIRLSILAGVDVLVFGNNVSGSDRVTASRIHSIIKQMIISGQIPESRIDESYQRIIALKKKSYN
jgi:beta-N-acetylhexosaminidase